MEIKLLDTNKKENRITFLVKGTTPTYANTLRRLIVSHTPTIAIHEVEYKTNSSTLYDEVLAHRLGLIPLKTDLSSYEVPLTEEDKAKAKCHVKLTLKAKGPAVVYASDLKSADPKVTPVFPKMMLVKLLEGQEIELSATAYMGYGKDHIKWAPAHVWYNFEPKVTVNNSSKLFDQFKDKYPKAAFDKSGKLDKKLIVENNLVDACATICEDIVKVEYNKENIIFNVESFGQLEPKEIVFTALEEFNKELEKFNNKIKKLEK